MSKAAKKNRDNEIISRIKRKENAKFIKAQGSQNLLDGTFDSAKSYFKNSQKVFENDVRHIFLNNHMSKEFTMEQGLEVIKNYVNFIAKNKRMAEQTGYDLKHSTEYRNLEAVMSSKAFTKELMTMQNSMTKTMEASNQGMAEYINEKSAKLVERRDMSNFLKAMIVITSVLSLGLLSFIFSKNELKSAFEKNNKNKLNQKVNLLDKSMKNTIHAMEKHSQDAMVIKNFADEMKNSISDKSAKNYFNDLSNSSEKQLENCRALKDQYKDLQNLKKDVSKKVSSLKGQVSDMMKPNKNSFVDKYANKDKAAKKGTFGGVQ